MKLGDRIVSVSDGLAGKTVVVTGAASGQGRAGAILFARAGANLAICDVDEQGLAETARLVAADSTAEVLAAQCDLTLVSDIEAFVKTVVDRFDVIDVIYNNTGATLLRSVEETSEADWDQITDANVKGPFFMVKYALPYLLKSDAAVVVNVASISALVPPGTGITAYCASTGAVMALTRAQARDLAPRGIRVNCLVPGAVDAPMQAGAVPSVAHAKREASHEAAVCRSLIPRVGTSDEVAAVAVFLASPAASYITGAMIPVDGGWTAC